MHLRLALSSGVWTLPVVPAVILKHVAVWSFANGGIVRSAGAGSGGGARKGSVAAGIVARIWREGTLGVNLGGTDSFDHLISFHFHFSISQLAH